MLHLLQAFGGPGRTALSFAPTYSMYPGVRPRHRHRLGRRAPRGRLHPRPRRAPATLVARAAAAASCCCRRRTTRPAPRCRPRPSRRCARRPDDGGVRGRRRGVRRVPPRRHAERAGAAAAHRNLVGHPHHEQGVRARRRPARLPRGGAGDLRRDPRRPAALPPLAVTQAVALAALRHADELLGRVDDLRAERDATVDWLRGAGARRWPTATPTSCCSARFADRHAVWQGLLDRGVLIRETGPDGWLRVSIGTGRGDGSIQGRTDALVTGRRRRQHR